MFCRKRRINTYTKKKIIGKFTPMIFLYYYAFNPILHKLSANNLPSEYSNSVKSTFSHLPNSEESGLLTLYSIVSDLT